MESFLYGKFFKDHPQNKIQLILICKMVRLDATTGEVLDEIEVLFRSFQESVYSSTNVNEIYEKMTTKILETFANYLKNGSGWVLERVIRLEINGSKLKPLRGSSHIPLPKKLRDSKSLLNMKNTDDQCFKWAFTRAKHPAKRDGERVTKELRRNETEEYNWDGMEFPTPCCEKVFKKFEENNNVSIAVFGYEEELYEGQINIIPLYVPKVVRDETVPLFFYKNGERSHYCPITNMSGLVSSQISDVCFYCVSSFGRKDSLEAHMQYCSKHQAVNVKMPEVGKNILKFKNIQNRIECPIKIVGDFESFFKRH